MNFNEDSTDPDHIEEEVKKWVTTAKKELKIQSLQKGLLYNYDFSADKPIKNAYSRLLWDTNSLISPKSIPRRSSSASQAKSSMSTAVALDYELMEYLLPSIQANSIEIEPNYTEPIRTSYQFCLRERLGSLPLEHFSLHSYSRSRSC